MFYIVLLLFVLVGGAALVLIFQNFPMEVQFSLLAWQISGISLGVLILAAFLLGALLLYMVSVASARWDKRELIRLHNRVSELEQAQARIAKGPLPIVKPMALPMVPMPGMSTPVQPAPRPPEQGYL